MSEQEQDGAAELVLDLDEENLTLGDMEAIEDVTGPIPEGGLQEMSQTKVTLALALVALRRDNPRATLEDARAVKISQIAVPDGDEGEAAAEGDPTG